MDFRVDPYDTEADPALWAVAHGWAAQAADAGLGVTVHAGEFSPANLDAALHTPGLRRLGHAVHAAFDPRLLERLARSGATVECCLTSNVVLGVVASYAAHPIDRFIAAGVPVTLNTDLRSHLDTTIGREYTIAATLGFTPAALLELTRNAIRASFTPAARRRPCWRSWPVRLPRAAPMPGRARRAMVGWDLHFRMIGEGAIRGVVASDDRFPAKELRMTAIDDVDRRAILEALQADARTPWRRSPGRSG